jgi:hypothetical protein
MTDRPGVYLALVHHPIRDRAGGTITTSVTNLDVHDLARAARTYGLRGYFVVTPIEAQRALVRHIMGYWREGGGSKRVPERAEALSIVREVSSLAEAIEAVTAAEGQRPTTVTTAARSSKDPRSFADVTAMVRARTTPVLLVFGTGYGLAQEVLDAADVHLAPVRPGGYNHLAVRSAVSIILDRLLGDDGA